MRRMTPLLETLYEIKFKPYTLSRIYDNGYIMVLRDFGSLFNGVWMYLIITVFSVGTLDLNRVEH